MTRRTPILETERLLIRELTMDDPEAIKNLASLAVMRKIGMTVERAKKPQPPDIFVVAVLDNVCKS